MDYNDKTDFEINKMVAERLGLQFALMPIGRDECDIVITNLNCNKFDQFDPCNNPSDAWPIILENKINIKYLPSSDNWAAEESKDICVYSIDKNPLRAAMIVYLMMSDNKGN